MMKGGGRLQALSFHYYTMPKARFPATAPARTGHWAFRKRNGQASLAKALTDGDMIIQAQRGDGQI